MGLINKARHGMFFTYEVWCVADVSSVSPSSEQTEGLWEVQKSSILSYSISIVLDPTIVCNMNQ